jgi:hypothetical protein
LNRARVEVGETDGQPAVDSPKAGGQVRHLVLGQIGGEGAVNAVGERAVKSALGLEVPGPHNHLVPVDVFEQQRYLGRFVLAVAVHHHQNPAPRRTDAGLDRGPVPPIVGVPNHARPGLGRQPRGVVRRAVVHHQHLEAGIELPHAAHHGADDRGLVIGRDDDRDGKIVFLSHGVRSQCRPIW